MTKTRSLETEARYVLVGSLAEGRRVLDIGCGDGRGLVQLAVAGAAEIVGMSATATVHDARATLAEAEIEGVEVLPDAGPPLSLDDDAFDLVICHDLPDRIASNDEWISEIRRILADDGYLMLAAANQEGQWLSELAGERGESSITYEEAFEKLADAFGEASLYGQSPVIASLFFDFGSEEEDPGLTFDGSLLEEEGEDPGWYVLIFGPEPPRRDDLLLIRHGFQRVVELTRGAPQPAMTAADSAGADATVVPMGDEAVVPIDDEARERAARTEAELDELRRELAEAKEWVEDAADSDESAARAEELEAELRTAQGEVERLLGQVAELEAQQPDTDTATEEVERLNGRIAAALKVLSDVEGALRRQHLRARDAEEQLAIERISAYRAQNDLQLLQDEALRKAKELQARLDKTLEETEQTANRLNEAHERQKTAERAVAEHRDQISQLEQSLQGAEQMFERTKAELIKIESGADERIAEAQALSEALIQQSAMASDAKIEKLQAKAQRDAEAAAEKTRAEAAEGLERKLEEEGQKTAEHIATLEAEASTKLEAAAAEAQGRLAELEQKTHEVVELETSLTEAQKRAQLAEETRDQAVEQIKNEARQKIGVAKDRIKVTNDARDEALARIVELEAETTRLKQDSASFEQQIKDLLEETAQIRSAMEQTKQEKTVVGGQAENLQAEVDHYKGQLNNIAAERDAMALEVQRLTDALHHQETVPDSAPERASAATAVDTSMMAIVQERAAAEQAAVLQTAAAHTAAAPAKRSIKDALGREIEPSLEELEDLLSPK